MHVATRNHAKMKRNILGLCWCLYFMTCSAETPACKVVKQGVEHFRFGHKFLTLNRTSGDGCFFELRLVEGDVRQTPRYASVRISEDPQTKQLYIANDTEALSEDCGAYFLRQVPIVVETEATQPESTLNTKLQNAYCMSEATQNGVGRYDVYAFRVGLDLSGESNASAPYLQFVNASGTKLYSQGGVLSLGYRANLGYSMLHFYPDTNQVEVPLSALSKEKLLIDWKFIWALATSATTVVFATMATYALIRA